SDIVVTYDVRNVNVGLAGNKLTIGHTFDTLAFADTFTLTFTDPGTSRVYTTSPIPVAATTAKEQTALELMPGSDPGDVPAGKAGRVDNIQGLLTIDGGAGNVAASTVKDGATLEKVREIQLLKVQATGGTFTLGLTAPGHNATSSPLAYNAGAA